MSEGAPTATATERTLLVPAILPNSLQVVLNIFGMDISRRRAKGSIRGTNQTLIDELDEYGGVHTGESHRIDPDDTTTERRYRSTTFQ